MSYRPDPLRTAAIACAVLAGIGLNAGTPLAQQKQTPLFFDARRLPDMEVERRNQEVLQEQRRVAEERRLEAEANAKRIADEAKAQEARIAAEAAAKKKAEEARVAAAEAQRKADEEKRQAAEADAKKKADEARVAAAEAQRKADEEKRQAAEADAKKKADEARVAAAEAQRKADEEKRVAAEAAAKKKADEARVAAAAEVQRRADEEKRLAAEAAAKKKADEVRLAAASAAEEKKVAAAGAASTTTTTIQRTLPQTAALAPQATAPSGPAASCEPVKAQTSQLPGGRMRIAVNSPCRKGQSISLKYGSYELVRKLDNGGQGSFDVDLFQGNSETIGLTYPDGHSESLQPAARDLAEVSKVALIWQAPVDLDLHAMENGSISGRWSGAPSTPEAAKALAADSGKGAGFLSMSDDGAHEGTKVEVYTFFHTPDQPSGVVSMSLDYVTRGNAPSGEFCGSGSKAAVPYEAVTLSPKGVISRERGVIAAATCGAALSSASRLIRDAVPDLQFGQ